MDRNANKRKSGRIDFSCEAKVHFLGEDVEISANIKDISLSGARVIIAGRPVRTGAPLEIKMQIKERDIQCRGRVAWALNLRPGLGNLIIFDVGIEFQEMDAEDAAFLEEALKAVS